LIVVNGKVAFRSTTVVDRWVYLELRRGADRIEIWETKNENHSDPPIIAVMPIGFLLDGTFADNNTCAVSCTGIGEDIIRNAVAFDNDL